MCGIYGYVGKLDAYEKVFEGLKMLQYRGYDSCGIAYYNQGFKTKKAVGTLDNLPSLNFCPNIAFGHTRWATNGEVNLKNTHPHCSYNKEYTIVHNGIITNAEELKNDLIKQKIPFYSQTDTEVIANMLACMKGEEEENILKLFNILRGTFSLIIGNSKGELYLVKQFSPLNVVCAEDGIYISSDVTSLKNGEYYSLEDGDVLKISNGNITSLTNRPIKFTTLQNDDDKNCLGEFQHFMLKEIFETPEAILNTFNWLKNSKIERIIKKFKHLTLLGCGTAYHSCLVGKYMLDRLNRFNIDCSLASAVEIEKKIRSNHLHIIVSQSGETADCIKVAEEIKAHNGKILIITNQEKSTITKYADYVIFAQAKKELAVASTKTYCSQVFVFSYIYNKLMNKNYDFDIIKLSSKLKNYITAIDISAVANKIASVDKLILIGRDVDYITMLEASLKIREINYIYTIPMLSSELKHGTLSLIEKGSYVLTLNTSGEQNKISSAVNEIQSRGGEVIEMEQFINLNIEDCYKPIFAVIPFQLLSYEIALKKGLNPDMPRNLAKSVTVE